MHAKSLLSGHPVFVLIGMGMFCYVGRVFVGDVLFGSYYYDELSVTQRILTDSASVSLSLLFLLCVFAIPLPALRVYARRSDVSRIDGHSLRDWAIYSLTATSSTIVFLASFTALAVGGR